MKIYSKSLYCAHHIYPPTSTHTKNIFRNGLTHRTVQRHAVQIPQTDETRRKSNPQKQNQQKQNQQNTPNEKDTEIILAASKGWQGPALLLSPRHERRPAHTQEYRVGPHPTISCLSLVFIETPRMDGVAEEENHAVRKRKHVFRTDPTLLSRRRTDPKPVQAVG